MANLLRVDQLAYSLPYRLVLQPLSFEVAASELVLITGASGAGKTLILRLLNRLTAPSSGQVYVADQDYRSMTIPQWRRQVSLVGAEPDLLGMTVQEALLYPLQLQKLSASQSEQRLVGLLEHWPIPEEWLGWRAAQLAKEQQQLVAVARSLVLEPRVLLLDEAAAYLSEDWLGRVRAIAQSQGMAVVATGQPLAVDRVLYLQAGQLAWDRSADTVDWEELRINSEQIGEEDW